MIIIPQYTRAGKVNRCIVGFVLKEKGELYYNTTVFVNQAHKTILNY